MDRTVELPHDALEVLQTLDSVKRSWDLYTMVCQKGAQNMCHSLHNVPILFDIAPPLLLEIVESMVDGCVTSHAISRPGIPESNHSARHC